MSTKARLLVSMPVLQDPNFLRAVVYMIEHNDEGALGVVLNRPLEIPAREILERWDAVFGDTLLSEGGPVSRDSAICLGVPRAEPSGNEITAIDDGLVAVNLESDPAIVAALVSSVRVFVGYAGWGPGQLESEIAEGAWHVCDGGPADVFSAHPERTYEDVMRRQRGQMKLLATYPIDPRMN